MVKLVIDDIEPDQLAWIWISISLALITLPMQHKGVSDQGMVSGPVDDGIASPLTRRADVIQGRGHGMRRIRQHGTKPHATDRADAFLSGPDLAPDVPPARGLHPAYWQPKRNPMRAATGKEALKTARKSQSVRLISATHPENDHYDPAGDYRAGKQSNPKIHGSATTDLLDHLSGHMGDHLGRMLDSPTSHHERMREPMH